MSEKELEVLGGQILALRLISALQMNLLMDLADDENELAFWFIGALRECKENIRQSNEMSGDVFEGAQLIVEAFVNDIKEIQAERR